MEKTYNVNSVIQTFNPKDQASFWHVHNYIRDIMHQSPDQYSDTMILKFFLNCYHKPEDTIKEITTNIVWRKTFPFDKSAELDPSKFLQLQKINNMNFYGVDKLGRPIRITKVLNHDPNIVMEMFTEEEFLLHNIAHAERLINIIFERCSERQKYPIYNTLSIIDVTNVKMTKILFNSKLKKFLKPQSQVFQDNYPEMAGNVFIINAGSFGSVLFNFIKLFLKKQIVEKISVYNNNYMKDLERFVDPKDLPAEIGGGCNIPIIDYDNFWQKDIDESINDKILSFKRL